MRVFITGGTGLIGRRLAERLTGRGDTPVVLSRKADAVRRDPKYRGLEVVQGDPAVSGGWESAVDGCDAVINLAGHNLFEERWSRAVKQKIRDSRVDSTERVVAAVAKAHHGPKVFVQGSAIGFYGAHGDEVLTEESGSGSDFMAVVAREWEEAAEPVKAHGVRLATVRTGVVLAKGEGALGAMVPVYKWLPGGAAPLGSGSSPFKPATGQQWMSWVHLDDIVGIFLLGLDNPAAEGPINGTSPNPARHVDFGKALATVLGRGLVYLPMGPPDAMIELVLGEVAQVITKGQKVLPSKAESLGYKFAHPELNEALKSVFAAKPAPVKAAPPKPAAAHH